MAQSFEDIRDYVYSKLGYPVVQIEAMLAPEFERNEVVFTGNGTTSSINVKLGDKPVRAGSVVITTVLQDGRDVLLTDSNGSIVGSGGSGSIDYESGNLVVNFSAPVQTLALVNVRYKIGSPDYLLVRAFENAKLWYSSRRGVFKMKFIRIEPGLDEYVIDDQEVITGVRNITLSSSFALRSVFSDYPNFPLVFYWTNITSQRFADLMMMLHQAKTLTQIFSSVYDTRVEGNKLVIIPTPTEEMVALVEYTVYVTNLGLLRPKEYEILRDYVLADYKEILGRIRGKYSSYPVTGGDVSFGDAETLISEAREDKEKLEKMLIDLFEPLPVVIGSPGLYNI